jgi:beta-mannanase
VNILGKANQLEKLPETVAGDFLKSHLGDGYYRAFIGGRIAIEWGDGHESNPNKLWWRFAKPNHLSL